MQAVPGYRFITTQDVFFTRGLEVFLREVKLTVQKRADATLYLLQNHPWDLAMVHFQSLDCVQHALWPQLPVSCEQFQTEEGKKIADFFCFLDEKIGLLTAAAGDSTGTIVVSDHGFGPLRKTVLLNKWLCQKRYLSLKRRTRTLLALFMLKSMKKLDPFKIRRVLLSKNKRVRWSTGLMDYMIDWERTKAFSVGTKGYGGIFVNLKGRERLGLVTEDQFSQLCRQLEQELLNIRDPQTSGRIVRRVYFPQDIYGHNISDGCPDLILEPEEGYAFGRDLDKRASVLENRFGRSEVGTHAKEGICVFSGPCFRHRPEITARIVDIAPTILALFGTKPPSICDGDVLGSILGSQPCLSRDAEIAIERKADNAGFTSEEEEEIYDRLRKLGYL
jgi:predicted AlkP superfamily phosphohydrolase/phosphomutase